ncbi:hypothetical protein ABIA33_001372 [Streptacidiphilus sp. MAP12-16]
MSTRRRLRLGSKCSGYGGLDLAVQRVFDGALDIIVDSDPTAKAARSVGSSAGQERSGDSTRVDWATEPRVDRLTVPVLPAPRAGRQADGKR